MRWSVRLRRRYGPGLVYRIALPLSTARVLDSAADRDANAARCPLLRCADASVEPAMRSARRGWRLALLAVVLSAAGMLVAGAESRGVGATDAAPQTVPLQAPWSFVVATEAGAPDAMLGTIPGLLAVYRWSAAAGTYAVWRAGSAPTLNTLPEVAAGDALWLQLSAPSSWTRPVFSGARTVAVADGWSTIGWTGPGAAASEVAATLGADRIIAYIDGRFLSFAAGLPPDLNRLYTVERGQALWVRSDGSRSVTIPDASRCDASYPGVCIPPPPPDLDCGDISVRRFRVIGADPHRFDIDGDGLGCES